MEGRPINNYMKNYIKAKLFIKIEINVTTVASLFTVKNGDNGRKPAKDRRKAGKKNSVFQNRPKVTVKRYVVLLIFI